MSASCLENTAVTLVVRKKQPTAAHNEQFPDPINHFLCLLWKSKLRSYAHSCSAVFLPT